MRGVRLQLLDFLLGCSQFGVTAEVAFLGPGVLLPLGLVTAVVQVHTVDSRRRGGLLVKDLNARLRPDVFVFGQGLG